MNRTPNSYEENLQLDAQIEEILTSKASCRNKDKALQQLQDSVTAPLSQSHIAYYRNKIHNKRTSLYKRLFVAPFVLIYLLITLYRTYFYIYPDKPHREFGLPFSNIILIVSLYLIPVFLLVVYLIQYFLSQKRFVQKPLKKYLSIPFAGIFLIFVLFCFHSYTKNNAASNIINGSETPSDNTAPSSTLITDEDTLLSKTMITEDASPLDTVAPEDFDGGWNSTYSKKCWLSIKCDDSTAQIEVSLRASFSELYLWYFTGTFNKEQGVISYTGNKIHEVVQDDGETKKEFLYTDGTGLFYLDQNYNLHWDDQKEAQNPHTIFQKELSDTDTQRYTHSSYFYSDQIPNKVRKF